MTKAFIYEVIRRHQLAVLATGTQEHGPEAAVVGFAVTEQLEIIFDTINTSRKYRNMIDDARVALVIGWDEETTIQYEGTAVLLSGEGADLYKEIYYSVFPDGRQRAATSPNLVHFKVIPHWVRYSNFNEPVMIEEMSL
jgi:general stress protein 26